MRLCRLLELRIAQHEAVVGVPEHEGFRDRLDGVAQAHVGGRRSAREAALLGDVDGDADQVRIARLADRAPVRRGRAARPSRPCAARMRNAWSTLVASRLASMSASA